MKLFREIIIIVLFFIAICSCNNQNKIGDRRKEAISLFKESTQIYNSVKFSKLPNNLYIEALQKINKAISLDSTYRQAYFAKTSIYIKQEEYTSALNWIDTVLIVAKNDQSIKQLQGILFAKTGNDIKADSIFVELLSFYNNKLNENSKDFLSFTSKMYMLTFLNQKDNALRQLDSMILLYPKENLLPMTKEIIENSDFDDFINNF